MPKARRRLWTKADARRSSNSTSSSRSDFRTHCGSASERTEDDGGNNGGRAPLARRRNSLKPATGARGSRAEHKVDADEDVVEEGARDDATEPRSGSRGVGEEAEGKRKRNPRKAAGRGAPDEGAAAGSGSDAKHAAAEIRNHRASSRGNGKNDEGEEDKPRRVRRTPRCTPRPLRSDRKKRVNYADPDESGEEEPPKEAWRDGGSSGSDKGDDSGVVPNRTIVKDGGQISARRKRRGSAAPAAAAAARNHSRGSVGEENSGNEDGAVEIDGNPDAQDERPRRNVRKTKVDYADLDGSGDESESAEEPSKEEAWSDDDGSIGGSDDEGSSDNEDKERPKTIRRRASTVATSASRDPQGEDGNKRRRRFETAGELAQRVQFNRDWDARFEELVAFKAQRGHCRVSKGNDDGDEHKHNKALANWVGTQRCQRNLLHRGDKRACMTEDREQRLESLGFTWDFKEDAWLAKFEELRAYKKIHGHCLVPGRGGSKATALGRWVGCQRDQCASMRRGKKTRMTQERKERLESLGFTWNTRGDDAWSDRKYEELRPGDAWNRKYDELTKYKSLHGHCRVSQAKSENKALGRWVVSQCGVYRTMMRGKNKDLAEERRTRLETLGVTYDVKEDDATRKNRKWEARLEELRLFKYRHGHFSVSKNDDTHKSLAFWVVTQREQYRFMQRGERSFLTKYRQQKLEGLEFTWDVKSDGNSTRNREWDARFEELRSYQAAHHHCRVPTSGATMVLGRWVTKQRGKRTAPVMTDSRRDRLDSLGFTWHNVMKDAWERNFDLLRRFQSTHGHCRVPTNGERNKALETWVGCQRDHYSAMRRGKQEKNHFMTKEREQRLESLGFVWAKREDPNSTWNEQWNARFKELRAYVSRHGHCRVSRADEENGGLGNWVKTQRCQYSLMKRGKQTQTTEAITKARVQKLASLGFVWNCRNESRERQSSRENDTSNDANACNDDNSEASPKNDDRDEEEEEDTLAPRRARRNLRRRTGKKVNYADLNESGGEEGKPPKEDWSEGGSSGSDEEEERPRRSRRRRGSAAVGC